MDLAPIVAIVAVLLAHLQTRLQKPAPLLGWAAVVGQIGLLAALNGLPPVTVVGPLMGATLGLALLGVSDGMAQFKAKFQSALKRLRSLVPGSFKKAPGEDLAEDVLEILDTTDDK